MNPMPLLLALLVVAYIGSLYTSTQGKRSFGSASGVEFVLLGALLGPDALGALNRPTVHAFDPIALMALGWIGLGYGVEWGVVGQRRTPFLRAILGSLLTVFVGLIVGFSVYRLCYLVNWLEPEQRQLAGIAAALVCSESARHAIRWVTERRVVSGPLATLIGDIAATDDFPVVIGLAAVFAQHSGALQIAGFTVVPWASTLGTLGIGATLGLVCAYLTYRDRSTVTGWCSLLGCACLATGFTTSLGLSAMGATFTMGLTLSVASPIGRSIRERIMRTEGALLLPALLLVGARLELPQSSPEILLLGVALTARIVANFGVGSGLALTQKAGQRAMPWLGFAMSSSGSLSMMVGLAFSVRLGGDLGRYAVTLAVLGTVIGEILGPFTMRRALERVGEVHPPQPADIPDASAEVTP